MKTVRQILSALKNMYMSREEYHHVKEEIRESNYKAINVICFLMAVIYFVVFLFSILSYGNFSLYQKAFLGTSIVCLILFLINVFVIKYIKQFVLLLAYILLIGLYSYGIYVGVFAKTNQQAVSFCVFVFLGPLFFIDRYWRIDLITVLAIIVFSILAFRNKPDEVAVIDTFNASVYGVISLLFYRYLNYIRIRDFVILHQNTIDKDYEEQLGIFNPIAVKREIKKNLLVSNKTGILIFIDLHNLGKVNDKYGLDSGDDIIKQFCNELKSIFRNTDIIGRYNSDQFLVFMPNLVNIDIAKIRSKMVLVSLSEKIKVPEDFIQISASIGIVTCSTFGETFNSLVKKGQTARDSAKLKGENQIVVFTDNLK